LEKFLKFWFPVIIYSGIIFCVSAIPNIRLPLNIWHFDKILHLVEFAPFGFLLARAFNAQQPNLSDWQLFFLAISVILAYGLSDEIHQKFVAGRDASLGDLIADVIGATGGITSFFFNGGKFRSQQQALKHHDRHQTIPGSPL
jgi:hypothetical protein